MKKFEKLDFSGFEKHLVHGIENSDSFGALRYIFRFENNYGASVVRVPGISYGYEQGLWELAVIQWFKDEWHITYNTDITDDVLGYLTDSSVKVFLQKIKELNV